MCFIKTAFRQGLTNISPENVLNLLLLETTLDDQSPGTVNGARSTQFSKQELSDVLVGPLHALANLGNVCENGLLVAFTQTLGRRDLVALAAARGKVRVVEL